MDINFNTNNKWVETGEPVTVSDVLMFEDNLRQTAEDKYLTNEAKKDLSQTQAAHALRQEWIHKVQDEIDALMEFERNKDEGTTKKTWFEQFEKINNTHKLADAAISVTFDATQREWSETSARIHMGRLVGTLVFQAVMNHNAGARRRLKRLEQKAAQVKGFDGVGRAERILEYAKEYGFDSDRWVNDVAYMSKHGAVLIATVLKALPEQFFREKSKRGKDSNLTWYINLKEQTTEELETLRNAALDTLTSYYGPMICPPRKWSKDNMGPYIRQERGWLVPLVRNASKEQASDIVQALRSNQFEVVLDALNAIQETPYSVNRYVVEAIDWVKSHMDPMTGENLIGLLERRLDAVVYRAKFVATVFAARQFVNHGHVTVNGKKVNIPSYRVKEGDVIEVRDRSKQIAVVIEATQLAERDVPDYIDADHSKMKATFVRAPGLGDVPYPVVMEPNLVIEYYAQN